MNPRLQKVRTLLLQTNLDAILVTDVNDIAYLTGFTNFSSIEREGFLFITKNDQIILTDGRYTEAVKKQVTEFALYEISQEKDIITQLKIISDAKKIQTVGFQGDNLTHSEYEKIVSVFKKKMHISLNALRISKEKLEVETIKKACTIADNAFAEILKKIAVGISENELAFELEIAIRKHDATISFPTIVAFNANAAIPHHETSEAILKKNSLVLIDFGARYNNYCSDCTRTFFFGEPPEEQKKIYQTVLGAQQKAVDFISTRNSEVKASDVDKIARDFIISQGYPSIPHSLGHGTGIEVHEEPRLSPKSKDMLKEGMVFSIEPGIYIPDFCGVRIEDLFTIENKKLIQLTKSPKNFMPV